MKIQNKLGYFVITILAFICAQASFATGLKEQIEELMPIETPYGTTNIIVSELEVIITKGLFESDTSGSGDGYSVLIKQQDQWQLARFSDKQKMDNNVLVWAMKHTGEDQISSVNFLKSKNSLYLLQASKNIKNNLANRSKVSFDLYLLDKDQDFDVFYFKNIASGLSKKEYKNSNDALQELNFPLG